MSLTRLVSTLVNLSRTPLLWALAETTLKLERYREAELIHNYWVRSLRGSALQHSAI